MRRHAVGLIALLLLVTGAGLWIWSPDSEGAAQMAMLACLKVGVLMTVLWTAYRDVERLPAWLVAVFPLLLAILAIRPRWFVFMLPLVIALAILRPRNGPRR
jgi:hypothetical protein